MKYELGGKVDQKVLDFSEKAVLFLQKLGTNCTICPKFFLAPVGGALCEGGKSTESGSRSANLESLPLGFLAVSENVRKAVSFTPYVGDAVPFFHINRA